MLHKIFSFVNTIISPPFCIGCDCLLEDYTVLCKICYAQLPQVIPHEVVLDRNHILTVYAISTYQEPLNRLIQAKLYASQTEIHQLAYLMAKEVKRYDFSFDYVVPIPLHWYRRLGRGFNQADILASAVATALDKPVLSALTRVRHTPFQSTLSALERKENVKNIFSYEPDLDSIVQKNILLIDDLYTTGATAAAAARELYIQGAARVAILVACKVTN